MKISRRHLKRLIAESTAFPNRQRYFMDPAFGGKMNTYNPYRTRRLHEEEEFPEPVEDAWAGGDNLTDPSDNGLKDNAGEENTTQQETLELTVSERKLRKMIRTMLLEIEL